MSAVPQSLPPVKGEQPVGRETSRRIEQFVFPEARMLDGEAREEWLGLLADTAFTYYSDTKEVA
ncbi:hypothetical protein D8I24_2209 (plasmid) [Cupriavidus necator H850]|uniref:hypothetical protein n=1 Tax=Cupriavidus necator TaxID=106590 RepID=UPI00129ECF39|nr:hypothetical protein [Cupriavidus necator]KAI3605978.1 hypothetical protein D8I24_2209 [Cupriavidus necator H850]